MKIGKFAVPALLALLLTPGGCSKEGTFDIRGEWSFRSASEELFVFLFIGLLKEGTLVEIDYPDGGGGHYSVSGEEIDFEFVTTLQGGRSCHFSGLFTSENQMSGTMEIVAPYPPFAWTMEVEGRKL